MESPSQPAALPAHVVPSLWPDWGFWSDSYPWLLLKHHSYLTPPISVTPPTQGESSLISTSHCSCVFIFLLFAKENLEYILSTHWIKSLASFSWLNLFQSDFWPSSSIKSTLVTSISGLHLTRSGGLFSVWVLLDLHYHWAQCITSPVLQNHTLLLSSCIHWPLLCWSLLSLPLRGESPRNQFVDLFTILTSLGNFTEVHGFKDHLYPEFQVNILTQTSFLKSEIIYYIAYLTSQCWCPISLSKLIAPQKYFFLFPTQACCSLSVLLSNWNYHSHSCSALVCSLSQTELIPGVFLALQCSFSQFCLLSLWNISRILPLLKIFSHQCLRPRPSLLPGLLQ